MAQNTKIKKVKKNTQKQSYSFDLQRKGLCERVRDYEKRKMVGNRRCRKVCRSS